MELFPFGHQIDLQNVSDTSGSLTICEPPLLGLFEIRRVYFLHSLAENARRGGHAHRRLHQLIIAASGSFTLDLTRFGVTKSILLNKPFRACYVPPWTWRDISEFSKDAVCLVLASETYFESDYIRDFGRFTRESELLVEAGKSGGPSVTHSSN